MPTNTTCLYTTVRNLDTHTRFFGFLPPHGRRLTCGEELTVWGDLQHYIAAYTPNERERRSLEAALQAAGARPRRLAIVNTPAVHLYDATLDYTKILTLDNATLATADPCWGAYHSSSIDCA